jgi:hypothetical protein
MRGGMSEEGQRRRAAIYTLNRPVPVMSAKGLPDIEPFPFHIPKSVLTRSRAPHGATVGYPPFAVVDTKKLKKGGLEELSVVTST